MASLARLDWAIVPGPRASPRGSQWPGGSPLGKKTVVYCQDVLLVEQPIVQDAQGLDYSGAKFHLITQLAALTQYSKHRFQYLEAALNTHPLEEC